MLTTREEWIACECAVFVFFSHTFCFACRLPIHHNTAANPSFKCWPTCIAWTHATISCGAQKKLLLTCWSVATFSILKTLPAWNAVCRMQNADALISPANVKMCEIGAICYLRCSCAIKCANWTPNPNQLNLNWLFMSMLICMSIITFFTLNTRTIALHLHQLHGASDADSLWLRHLKHFIVFFCANICKSFDDHVVG